MHRMRRCQPGRVVDLVKTKVRGKWKVGSVPGRRAFTVIELLVVIAVISLIMALIVPAVMSARGAARRTQCQNNLKNLGLATVNWAEAQKRFPAAGYFGRTSGFYHNWVVDLLPWIEQSNLFEQWDRDQPYTIPEHVKLASTSIPLLICPDDISATGQGDLSYAVNSGFGWTAARAVMQLRGPIDLNGDAQPDPDAGTPSDRELLLQSGLFFVENWPAGTGEKQHHSLNSISDGLSHTIMIADSIRSGVDPNAHPMMPTNWACPQAQRSAFYLSGHVCLDLNCSAGQVDYQRANSRDPAYSAEAINSARTQAEGEAPWASSWHNGGVHVVFADGHVQFLSELIDGGVYAALLSPQGGQMKGPLAQGSMLPSVY